jgi:hypothetical protein
MINCDQYYRYARLIFDEKLEPKMVQGRAITAPELMTYFEVYVRMFQSGNKSFPKVCHSCSVICREFLFARKHNGR